MLYVAPSCWNKRGHGGFRTTAALHLLVLSYTVYGHIFASVFLRWGDRCYIQRSCPRNEGHGSSSSSSTSPHPSSSPVASTGRAGLFLLHIFLSFYSSCLQIRAGQHIFPEGHTDLDKVHKGHSLGHLLQQIGMFWIIHWPLLSGHRVLATMSDTKVVLCFFEVTADQMKMVRRPMCDVDCSYTMIYLTFSLRWLCVAQPTPCLLNLCPWWPCCSFCSSHGNSADHEATIPESGRDLKDWETTS